MNYQEREGKKTFLKSGRKGLLWVTKDVGVDEVLVTWEVRASDVYEAGDHAGSLGAVRKYEASLPGCGWFQVSLLFSSLPPPTFSFLLTFTLGDDTWSDCDLTLKSRVTCSLSYVANTQKLSSDWQSICYLLNLLACVILANAFVPKKSPLSGSCCSVCWYFSPGDIREEKNRTVSLCIYGFDNILSLGLL